jgi:hypothetical protein
MLSARFGAALEHLLLPPERFHPYPTADEREAWEALPADLRAEQVAQGEGHLGRDWPPLPATLFLDFTRTGNRSRYEQASFARRQALAELVVAECVEGRGRFLDDIANGIWAICEESFWGVPAHNDGPLPDVERPIFDLFAGETAGLLALTAYLLGPRLDALCPRLRARIRHEVDRRILRPFLQRDDFWWMGLRGARRLNNWTPWCCSNALAAGLCLETDPARRAALVARAMACLDRYLDSQPRDGGCDEGTSYWDRAAGALFDCLEWLRTASAGAIDVYGEPLIRDMGRYLYRMHIADDWFVNFADGSARVHISADLVHRFGRRIADPGLAALGAWVHARRRRAGQRLRGPLPRLLPALLHFRAIEADAATATPPYLRDVWLPELQVMAARTQAGSAAGLYLAAKGGHNGESHNHNDVGHFVVYADGQPAVVDAGVGTYTAQTFSSRRYEIWTMRSAYHNLPTVRGVEQAAGEAYRARDVSYRADEAGAELSLDIAGAYPPEAGIAFWRRTLRLARGGRGAVEVVDAFRLRVPTDEVALTLMCSREPRLSPAAGVVELAGSAPLHLAFDPEALEPTVEALPLEDPRLRGVWGERLWRLVLRSRKPVQEGRWRLEVRPAP